MSLAKNVKEQIDFLIKLQVLDEELYLLGAEKKEIPEKIKAIDEALESKKTDIKNAENDLKTLQVKLKDGEINLQQKEEQIKKLDTQLYQLKSNKEYSTMLSEIAGVKADNSSIEEEIIKLMDNVEATKKKIMEEKVLFEKEENDAKKNKEIIKSRQKEIDVRFSELSAQRQEAIFNIEKKTLIRYEKVLKNKDGLAIVPIEGGACGGCHMNLPSQVVSEAKIREDIITCGSCSRILYIDDNVEIN